MTPGHTQRSVCAIGALVTTNQCHSTPHDHERHHHERDHDHHAPDPPVAPTGSALVSEQGRTSIADTVVSKIAGIATREISGVHDLGGGASRAVGASASASPARAPT